MEAVVAELVVVPYGSKRRRLRWGTAALKIPATAGDQIVSKKTVTYLELPFT